MIPSNCKLVSFFDNSLNKLSKTYIEDKTLNQNPGLVMFKSFRSSLHSHPLRVTMHNSMENVCVLFSVIKDVANRAPVSVID